MSVVNSKRAIAVVVSIALIVFKDRIPIDDEQLKAILAAIASLVVGDSIKPIGAVSDLLKDTRVLAAISAVAVSFLKDKLPITEADATNIVYLVASWILGVSIRPPDVNTQVKSVPSKEN